MSTRIWDIVTVGRNGSHFERHGCYILYIVYQYLSDSSSCARQNDVNAHVILPGAHRSARHMRRTFDTCFTLSLIYHLYVLFVWISYQARFGLKISYPVIVFYNGNRIVKLWEFYRSHPSAGNKQSLHIVSFSALRMRSRPSAGHTTSCPNWFSDLYNRV